MFINNFIKPKLICYSKRFIQTEIQGELKVRFPHYLQLSENFKKDEEVTNDLVNNMIVHEDFLSLEEEENILNEIEPYLKKMHYEFDHWDNAIHGYRETERLTWNADNTKILDRIRNIAFPPNVEQLKYVHILDLEEKGYIKPHIDAVRFCGDTIAGLSLLTDCVMRLVHEKKKDFFANIYLKRRSLYIMKNTARYDYTHEILCNEQSLFKDKKIKKHRRISVICRNEPKTENKS